MKKQHDQFVAAAVACLFILQAPSFSQAPQIINYQGRLLNGTNLAQGTVQMELRLFDASSGGNHLYTDSNTVTVVDGLYSTFIGDNPASDAFIFALANAEVWVEVAVDGEALVPRERLASVGYSLSTRGLLLTPGGDVVLNSGNGNTAGGNNATVGGGVTNSAAGWGSTVSGGYGNTANGGFSAIGGGESVIASGWYSAVGGGRENVAFGYAGTIGGGGNNMVSNDYPTVGGGGFNIAEGNFTTVGGGYGNIAGSQAATVGGGELNTAGGQSAAVGGGRGNNAGGNNATVAGGMTNSAGGWSSAVGGGAGNTANGGFSAVGGGESVVASGWYSAVGGGRENAAVGYAGTIGGGGNNMVSNDYPTVGGGGFNTAEGNFTTVGGGYGNMAKGTSATIPGGYLNAATTYAFAAGQRAYATNEGAFVWGDASTEDYIGSTSSNQFLIRAAGGMGINTNNPGSNALSVNGNVQIKTIQIMTGSGVPAIAAPNGSMYLRVDGGSDSTLYIRANGSWSALGAPAPN